MKLSIISINLNNSEGLERTIQSILAQGFTNYEYIIVDGASTDCSIEIIKKYDKRITRWISEPDDGIYGAMNKGVRLAAGEYCLFLNSGDILEDGNALNRVFAIDFNQDIIYGNLIINNSGIISKRQFPSQLTAYYFIRDTLPHPATLIKKELLIKSDLYDENLRISADHDFFQRSILCQNATYLHINMTFSMFFTDGMSYAPQNTEIINYELDYSLKKNLPCFYEDLKLLFEIKNDSLIAFCIENRKMTLFRILIRIIRLAISKLNTIGRKTSKAVIKRGAS